MPADPHSLARALLALARPALDRLPPKAGRHETTGVLCVAHLAWNAVAYDLLDGNDECVAEARTELESSLKGPERERVLALFSELVQRKRAESPPDLRVIDELRFLKSDRGELGLQATEGVVLPLTKRKRAPRQSPHSQSSRLRGGEFEGLFLAARLLHALAPWRWMQNGDVFGVLDPVSGEIGWCSVMGAGGELFGLAVYRGDEGYEYMRRAGAGDFLEDEALYGQPAIVLTFLDRAELSKADLALIRGSGVKFRGAQAWPQIDSHAPNRLPQPPSKAELEFMRVVLEQLVKVAARVRQDPSLVEPDRDGRLFLQVPPSDSGEGGWTDARRTPPPPVVRSVPEFDLVRAERTRRTLPREELEIECDLFPLRTIIEESGRSRYAPATFLAVASADGTVLHSQMTEPAGRDAWVQAQFLQLVEQLAARPTVAYVKRPSLERVLQPVADAVDVRLERVQHLNALDPAREFLERATMRS